MTTLREAAQQALEFIETTNKSSSFRLVPDSNLNKTVTALRAALAEPEHKPHCALLQIPSRECDCEAEPAPEPVAVVGTQFDVWRFYNGQWAPPGEPIKMAYMLKDLPVGTMLYAAPPQQPEPVIDRTMAKRIATQLGWVPQPCPNCASLEAQNNELDRKLAEMERKPLSLTDLQEALVLTNLIDRDAIDNPEEYDEGSTLAQIDALYLIIIKE